MTDWWVRPNTSHSGTRNGTSYANAWGGWSEIVAGNMAATDRLIVCGAHSYSATISAPKAGTDQDNRFTIVGDYPPDLGSITFSGAFFFNNNRANQILRDVSITGDLSVCIYHNSTCSNNTFQSIVLTGGTSGIDLASGNGSTHSNLIVDDVDFVNQTGTTGSAAIRFFVTATGAIATLDGMIIRNCEMSGLTSTQVMHFRTESDTNASSLMSNILVEKNLIRNSSGVGMRFHHDQLTSASGGKITIRNNVIKNLTEDATTIGGGVTASGFSAGHIVGNHVETVAGAYGGANVFYGAYTIERNYIKGTSASAIDANGVLVDHGANNTIVRENHFENINGSAATNSGAVVMVLDATGVVINGNRSNSARMGLFFSSSGIAQSCTAYNNTFLNNTAYGIYLAADATRADVYARNNVFSGNCPFVNDAGSAWTNENYNAHYGMQASVNHTNGANNVTTDPKLVGYELGATSPCIGAGTSTDVTDFNGERFTEGKYDIGAIRAKQGLLPAGVQKAVLVPAKLRT